MIETLSITLLVEGVVCLGYTIRWRKPSGSIFITSIFANLITQSLLWITLNLFYDHYLITLCVVEILIWVIESFMLYGLRFNQLKIREAFVLSLMMNLSSFGVGWFLPV